MQMLKAVTRISQRRAILKKVLNNKELEVAFLRRMKIVMTTAMKMNRTRRYCRVKWCLIIDRLAIFKRELSAVVQCCGVELHCSAASCVVTLGAANRQNN